MEAIKKDIEDLLLVQEQLKSEQLEKIDFDNLIKQLEKTKSLYENYLLLNSEFKILKENVIHKMTIMRKATEAVSKKRPNIKELETELAELASVNSLKLLQIFEKTETKYHSAFPSTFQVANYNRNKTKDYKSYK